MNRCERDFEFQSTTMSSNEQIACPHNVNCLKGVKYTGEPIGKTLEFGGLSTYVSEPSPENREASYSSFPMYLDLTSSAINIYRTTLQKMVSHENMRLFWKERFITPNTLHIAGFGCGLLLRWWNPHTYRSIFWPKSMVGGCKESCCCGDTCLDPGVLRDWQEICRNWMMFWHYICTGSGRNKWCCSR